MTADEMISALNAFKPHAEFDNNQFHLHPLTKDFKSLPDREGVVPAMFSLMERFPDAYLGTPGPLVHNIESLGVSAYEEHLIASVRRQPAELNVWMVNRILSSDLEPAHRQSLLEVLKSVLQHPTVPARVTKMADGFLKHQANREGVNWTPPPISPT